MSAALYLNFFKLYWKSIFIVVYPLTLLPIFLCNNTREMRCFYVVALMGGYWVFEVLPYAVTALIPLVLFPLMGVLDTKVTSMQYMKDSNMMFIGGLIIALAVEYCNLHTRISLHAIKLIGCSYRRLNFGLVTLTMLISMWISNTAATAMMTPIIEAVLMQLEEQGMSKMFEESENPEAEKEDPSLRKPTRATMCFYISTAYAATIGGLGCIVGSGTNLVFKGIYETHFKEGEGVDFNKWLGANIPLMLLIMYPSWIWIQIWYMGLCRPNSKDAREINVGKEGEEITRKVLVGKLEEMGKCSAHEILVGIMFVIVVLLWFFRRPGFMPGWPKLITEMAVGDATAAMIVVLFLFILPSRLDFLSACSKDEEKRPTEPAPGLLTWRYVATKMHWGLVFLLGSGFALAEGIRESGMGQWVAEKLDAVSSLPDYAVLVIACLLASVVTQFTSNSAVANILLPIVANMSQRSRRHPMYLMMPVCLSCSFAFCLPVATPPNAIVVAPSNMRTPEMIKVGLGVQFIALVAIIVLFPHWGLLFWDFKKFPEWAEITITKPNTSTT